MCRLFTDEFACDDPPMGTSLRTVVEAAAQLHITPGAVRDAIARGRMIPVRLGGRGKHAGMLLIPDEQIALYRERHLGKRGADPGDAHVFAAAIVADADYVVSNNTRDFPPRSATDRHEWNGIVCLTPQEFLAAILD